MSFQSSLAARSDLSALQHTFQSSGHVRLNDVLGPQDVEALSQAISSETSWSLMCAGVNGNAELSPTEIAQWLPETRKEFENELLMSARRGEGFVYYGHRLTGELAPHGTGGAFGNLYRWLTSPDTRNAIAQLTGCDPVQGAVVQATKFTPGNYLTRHLDDPAGESRQIAFVFGLTPTWHPDWGGLLQFYHQDGTPQMTFAPGYNTLDVFSVRRIHSVTYVTPFAAASRHVVSGWFVS